MFHAALQHLVTPSNSPSTCLLLLSRAFSAALAPPSTYKMYSLGLPQFYYTVTLSISLDVSCCIFLAPLNRIISVLEKPMPCWVLWYCLPLEANSSARTQWAIEMEPILYSIHRPCIYCILPNTKQTQCQFLQFTNCKAMVFSIYCRRCNCQWRPQFILSKPINLYDIPSLP